MRRTCWIWAAVSAVITAMLATTGFMYNVNALGGFLMVLAGLIGIAVAIHAIDRDNIAVLRVVAACIGVVAVGTMLALTVMGVFTTITPSA